MKRLLVLTILLAACSSPENKTCPDECGLGQVCDTSLGLCVSEALQPFQEATPGRSVRLAVGEKTVYAAAIDPNSRQLLAGEVTREGASLVQLAPISAVDAPLVIRTSQARVFVAWLAPDQTYRVASRPFRAPNNRWDFQVMAADSDYTGTQEFDLAVGEETGVYLAFQATDRTLRLLSQPDSDSALTIETVDTGGPSANGISCPDALRSTEAPAGVGLNPSIALNDAGIAIAYQDADCGDLRLARRVGETFSVDVVDTGSLEGEPAPARRGRVGREISARYFADSGRLFIAYLDESRARLMLATTNDAGRYEFEVVDTGLSLDRFARERRELIGAYATLSFGPRGEPSISHMNASATEVRFSQRPSGGGLWFHETLTDQGLVGFSTSHVFVPDVGLVVAAERLIFVDGALESQLEVIWP